MVQCLGLQALQNTIRYHCANFRGHDVHAKSALNLHRQLRKKQDVTHVDEF
jgi:hypothetical protein